jgi:hypothetical protein
VAQGFAFIMFRCADTCTHHRSPEITFVRAVQEALTNMRPYTSVLDTQNSLGRPSTPLLLRHCHSRAGERFAEWLRRTPHPLQSDAATVREAAAFAAALGREVHVLDPGAQLQVCNGSCRLSIHHSTASFANTDVVGATSAPPSDLFVSPFFQLRPFEHEFIKRTCAR